MVNSTSAAPAHPVDRYWSLVCWRAERSPDAPMLRDLHGRTLTFAEHRDRAQALAGALCVRGIVPGSVVAWQLPTSIEAVTLMAACSLVGAVQVPLVPTLRRKEVDVAAFQTRPSLMLAPATWRGFDHGSLMREVAGSVGAEVAIVDLGADAAGLGEAHEVVPPGRPPDGVDWIFYSSGTTGVPKGARNTDAGIIAASRTVTGAADMSADDVFPIPFPVGHVGGPAMLAAQQRIGFEILLIDQFDAARTPFQTPELTILGSAPPFFHAYLAAQATQPDRPLLPQLRVALSGGAPSSAELHRRVRDELGGVGVISVWGMTECPMATATSIHDADEVIATTVGRASPDVEIRIVGDDGRSVDPGEEGEILVRAPQVTLGYVDGELDDASFDADRFLRTGDLGMVDLDGVLRVSGRKKDVIIRNAENIAAAEVEHYLARHPWVADVAVVGVHDPLTGERCRAVIVPHDGAPALDLPTIVAFCRDEGLAPYKAPEEIVVVSELPRDALGKVAKAGLRALVPTSQKEILRD